MVCGHNRCGPQSIELRAELTSPQTRNPAWKVIGFRDDSGVAGGWPQSPWLTALCLRTLMMTFDAAHGTAELIVDRRSNDRRIGKQRRKTPVAEFTGTERRDVMPERRAKVERRRQIDPTTCERDYNEDEVEFMSAMDQYKRNSGRMFPTWSEVLEVVRSLGYRKVAEPCEINIEK